MKSAIQLQGQNNFGYLYRAHITITGPSGLSQRNAVRLVSQTNTRGRMWEVCEVWGAEEAEEAEEAKGAEREKPMVR